MKNDQTITYLSSKKYNSYLNDWTNGKPVKKTCFVFMGQKDGAGSFMAVDNRCGNFWKQEFSTIDDAYKWLRK